MNFRNPIYYVIFFWFINPYNIWAQIELPEIFSDHMIMQREQPIPIWGTTASDIILEISLGPNKVTVKADYFGKWKANLPPMDAGGPYELTIQSPSDLLQLRDIYVGEVWLCSGQSNMEWPLKNSVEGGSSIPQSSNKLIRFFHLKKKHDTYKTPYSPAQLIAFSKGKYFHPTKWEVSSPETRAEFSAVAYFFGKELHDSLNVPIGLIQAAVGGSPAQSWASKETLASHPQLRDLVQPKENKTWLDSEIIHPWLAVRAKDNWANWEPLNESVLPGHPFAPNYLYDYAIKPISPYGIRGAIWYQGESNATHPPSYFPMMKMLLKSWRNLWQQGDFPFYYVQLPKIGNRNLWPEFRAAQQRCLTIPSTGMVVAIDKGHPTDVHPKEKKTIGQRLANLALSKTYYKNVLAESPMLDSFEWSPKNNTVTIQFKNAYDGLNIKNGQLPKGFSIQGYIEQGTTETILPPELVSIERNKITLTYPNEFLPTQIKYAWAPYPENNIINSASLPLAPFKINLGGNN